MMVSMLSQDSKDAYRLGGMAMEIMERKHYQVHARVHLGYYGYLHCEQNPLRDSLEGMSMGEQRDNASYQTDVEVRSIVSF